MPQIATYAQLKTWGEKEGVREAIATFSKSDELQTKTVFLSHSTQDDELVAGVVVILKNHGGNVYVDHADPTLPDSDCLAIAENLRTAIKGCRRFVALASPRSKDSKWIPWELGLGDGIHDPASVAVFPSAESSTDTKWSEREYLGLYRRIVWGELQGEEKPLWLVWDFRKNTAEKLTSWLSG